MPCFLDISFNIQNEEFGTIRTLSINNEHWFVGKDVAEILQYHDVSGLRKIVYAEDRQDIDSQNGLFTGYVQNGRTLEPNKNVRRMLIINESGLYQAIFGSKLPKAKEFKRWVTSEVLPSIRKTGGYIAGANELSDEEIMAKALLIGKRTIEQQKARIEQLESYITQSEHDLFKMNYPHIRRILFFVIQEHLEHSYFTFELNIIES